MELHIADGSLRMVHQGVCLLHHTVQCPSLAVGTGKARYDMNRGNFDIEDTLFEKIPLREMELIAQSSERIELVARGSGGCEIHLHFAVLSSGEIQLKIETQPDWPVNRIWLRIPAIHQERVYGCGEQFSYFNLRGKRFPLWVSEQGVGRNKKTYETFLADSLDNAGGDYYTTYYPQPTFVSSQHYYVHIDDSHYMEFDFRDSGFHELCVWSVPAQIVFGFGDTFAAILGTLTHRLGRQPVLPDWAFDGVWLGIQGGSETVRQKLNRAVEKGVLVGAVWAQDWEGKRITSFGKQLMWNWKWDQALYPKLDEEIQNLERGNVRFLGYINCFLALEGDLYQEAVQGGYLVRNRFDHPYHVYITAFPAAMVDLTNPNAVAWIKGVIRREMIDFGLSGWMADFGEYLPTDAVLYTGDAEEMHNQWPVLWAKINKEVVDEAGHENDIVFFTRAGYTGTARYSTMMWAGDQNVDWSLDDGLPSVITAALSLGMSGIGLHHSDIGGYTTLFHMKRTKELFMRWVELAAFTVLMRTHEGNRPEDNWQFDADDETLLHFARMSQIHVAIKDYLKELVEEVKNNGLPVVRPLFLHYEKDDASYDVLDEYLLGKDLLVAPVIAKEETNRRVYLPPDEWIHLWSKRAYGGGTYDIAAPIGFPPVFVRAHSKRFELFEEITQRFGQF